MHIYIYIYIYIYNIYFQKYDPQKVSEYFQQLGRMGE